MNRSNLSLMFLTAAMGCICASLALAELKPDVALAKAPTAVQEAARKWLAGKKLTEFSKSSIAGKVYYEIGFKVDGVDHAYLVSESGSLVEEEADVELRTVPAVVIATVRQVQPKGKIDEALIATTADKKFYEFEVKLGNELHSISVELGGKLIADEIETPLPVD